MPDVVDKIVSGAGPAARDSAPSQKPPEKDLGLGPDGQPLTPYARQLQEQLKRERTRSDRFESELGEMRQSYQRLSEARVESPPSAAERPNPTSLTEFSDSQLAASIQETAEAGNWSAHESLIQEKVRRQTEAAIRAAEERAERKFDSNSHRASVMNGIQREFFPEATSEQEIQSSDLWNQADIEYANLLRVHGKDAVNAIPELQELCLRRARDGSERRNSMEEMQRLRDQVSQLQADLQAAERSSKGISREETQMALKEGGVKSALGSVVGNLYADKLGG